MYKSFMYKPFANHSILSLCRCIIPSVFITSLTLFTSQANATESSMEYYHYNHQGSLLEVYDAASNKRLLSQAWSPWGERQVLQTNTRNNNTAALLAAGLPVHIGYTGHKELLSTGLTFAGDTRLYDARLKRFLNSDDRTTGGIRGQNRYSYAYNNPMTYIDPDGHAPRLSKAKELAKRFILDNPIHRNTVSLLTDIATIVATQGVGTTLNDSQLQFAMAALIKIQSNYRGYRARKAYLKEYRDKKHDQALASFHQYYKEQCTKHINRLTGSLPNRRYLHTYLENTQFDSDKYFKWYYDYNNCRGNPERAAKTAIHLGSLIVEQGKLFQEQVSSFEEQQRNGQLDQPERVHAKLRGPVRVALSIAKTTALYDYFVYGHFKYAEQLGLENYHAVDYQQPIISGVYNNVLDFNIGGFRSYFNNAH